MAVTTAESENNMYEEYENEKISPMTVVKDLKNYKLTEEEAIKRIEYLMYKAIQEEAPMGKEEMKDIKEYIAELLIDRYDMPSRGNADCINDSLNQALKELGLGSDFKKIPRKHYQKIKDILFHIV